MKRLSILTVAVMATMLVTVFPTTVYSQEQKSYYELSKYSKWSLVAGPVLYKKAKLTRQYGDLTFENQPMLGFNTGLLY